MYACMYACMHVCVEWVKKPKSSYSTLWVKEAYVSNFDSTASFGSDQRLTLRNIIDGNLYWYHGRGSWSYEESDNEIVMS